MFSHAIPCQGGVTRAERERGVFLEGEGRGCSWRTCCFVRMDVNTVVRKAVMGFRSRVLSGLDACKINILWTLPLH